MDEEMHKLEMWSVTKSRNYKTQYYKLVILKLIKYTLLTCYSLLSKETFKILLLELP